MKGGQCPSTISGMNEQHDICKHVKHDHILKYTDDSATLNNSLLKMCKWKPDGTRHDVIDTDYALVAAELMRGAQLVQEEVSGSSGSITLYHGGLLSKLTDKGDSVYLMGFLSTSCDEEVSKRFLNCRNDGTTYNSMYVITTPTSVPFMYVNDCSEHKDENEYILPPGTNLTVTNITYNDGMHIPCRNNGYTVKYVSCYASYPDPAITIDRLIQVYKQAAKELEQHGGSGCQVACASCPKSKVADIGLSGDEFQRIISQSGSGSNKILILGRWRNVVIIKRVKYVKYMGRLTRLSELKKKHK